jgi:hypothetical protein
MRRILATLALLTLTLTITATPATATARLESAWECPTGYLCVWERDDGTGDGCQWPTDDNNWAEEPATCYLAGHEPMSLFNNNQSPSYRGVAMYINADYTGFEECIRQGQKISHIPGEGGPIPRNLTRLSHRWTPNPTLCP